jgi:WD40 repeat protein
MYIRDMRNTKGHVSGLTCGVWHPTDRFTAMTASEDGTVRCVRLGLPQHARARACKS